MRLAKFLSDQLQYHVAACFPSAVLNCAPSFPVQGLPSRLAMCPLKKSIFPLRAKGTKAATGAVIGGKVMLSLLQAIINDFVISNHKLRVPSRTGVTLPPTSIPSTAAFTVNVHMQNAAASHPCSLLAVKTRICF